MSDIKVITEAYQKIIDLLAQPDVDYRNLLIEVAKNNPEEVLRAARGAREVWWDEIDRLLRDNKKINAIKQYRNETGYGLIESKEAVEVRQKELGLT